MAIHTAIALWIPKGSVAPSQIASTIAAGLPALVQQRVPIGVHRLSKPAVTFVCANLDHLGEFHPYTTRPNLMDPLAASLAKALDIRVFSLFAMAGSVACLRVAAFRETGAPAWEEMLDSEVPFARLARELKLPRRKYVGFDAKGLLEPRGGGWKQTGEVKHFQPDPADLPPEELRTGEYQLFDPLPSSPPPPPRESKAKKKVARVKKPSAKKKRRA